MRKWKPNIDLTRKNLYEKKNKRLTKKRKHRKVKETHTHNLCLPPFFRIFVIVHIHNATAAASSSSRHTPLDAVLYDSHNIYTHTRALGVRTIFLFVHSGMVRYDDSNDSVTTTLPENHKRHERQGRAKFGCLSRSSVFVKPYKTPVAFLRSSGLYLTRVFSYIFYSFILLLLMLLFYFGVCRRCHLLYE